MCLEDSVQEHWMNISGLGQSSSAGFCEQFMEPVSFLRTPNYFLDERPSACHGSLCCIELLRQVLWQFMLYRATTASVLRPFMLESATTVSVIRHFMLDGSITTVYAGQSYYGKCVTAVCAVQSY
jgi:hypothetical protein